jgi:hypothetical protein
MRKKIFTLSVLALTSCFVVGAAPDLTINYTWPKTIDGNDYDWAGPWIPMDSLSWDHKTSALKAKFQMQFDTKNLYVIYDVQEDNVLDTLAVGNTWQSDNIEMTISLDTTSSTGITGMYHFAKKNGYTAATFGIGTGNLFANDVPLESWNADPNCKIVDNILSSTEHMEEWQLPWDSLQKNMSPAWDKKQFKFETWAVDNTDTSKTDGSGRTEIAFWHGGSNLAWDNTKYCGVVALTFGGCGDDCHPPGIKTLTNNDEVKLYIIGDNLNISRNVSELSIYNSVGQLILKANKTSNVNISTLRKGLYIAIAGGKSCKFLR